MGGKLARETCVFFFLACLVPAAAAPDPRAVGESVRKLVAADWLEQVKLLAKQSSVPARRPARVATSQDAAGGCDGIKNGRWGFHTASKETDPWWQVDLGRVYTLDRVVIYNRTDRNTAPRTRSIQVLLAEAPKGPFKLAYKHDGTVFYGVREKKPLVVSFRGKGLKARVVRLRVPGRCSFALDEVEVYPVEAPADNVALGKPADQKSVGPYSYPGTLPQGVDTAPAPGPAPAAITATHARLVIERARKLAARLADATEPKCLKPLLARLDQLETRLKNLEGAGEGSEALYLAACALRRQIAFANPLLDFDKLLFIKRHDPGGPFHMCDQYYGCNARPGGGLFVLLDPFGPEPKVVNLLEGSVVENGRLKGRKLVPGSFLSPEVSFDGKTILFAYSEAKAKKTYTWNPECCYHIFKVNADGSGLSQLTDGAWDDFDPCFLPNGRIAFNSTRRGGYLRCGRHCPTYALHSMAPDGSDIVRLSYHETHEWHPSVANDGTLVYTRWDYVDRDTNIAHHIWQSYPDGRDARSYHGNYPVRRQARPWMEMSIRAIPGSHKFVAATGAHHGNAFGSLVLIDQWLPDDGAMLQLERLTPETPFPEAEGRPIRSYMVYGTPWPLSEDDFLVVYDPRARNRGIYWIDRDGNKELIYRDPTISCLSPVPLRPRPKPPEVPEMTNQVGRAAGPADQRGAEILVLNVYDSDFQWPPGTRITALRIIELVPKSTPPPNKPRIGVANQTNARAVLGTVPVEPDGSAWFRVPPERLIYFQALDERSMAVQSMRSATYLHPGERLTCRGCHERKRTAPAVGFRTPMALRGRPSTIAPDAEGSNPFNYARLVQPVLDRHCVRCHEEKKALDLSGRPDRLFTRSYNNLAGKYGFYYHVSNGSINTGIHGGVRTIPGKFGARAAPLLRYLQADHYGVKLPPEDFHRVVLWLDCNSEFLGAYERAEAQVRGELVEPSLH